MAVKKRTELDKMIELRKQIDEAQKKYDTQLATAKEELIGQFKDYLESLDICQYADLSKALTTKTLLQETRVTDSCEKMPESQTAKTIIQKKNTQTPMRDEKSEKEDSIQPKNESKKTSLQASDVRPKARKNSSLIEELMAKNPETVQKFGKRKAIHMLSNILANSAKTDIKNDMMEAFGDAEAIVMYFSIRDKIDDYISEAKNNQKTNLRDS